MAAPLYVKQYGERRTGTNALRALIAANYDDVVVLMHILGDKHSPPASFSELWREAQTSADPAWELVARATFESPSLTTSANDRRQIVELRRVAAGLAEAYANGTLGFVISTRNPYTWAVSLARFLGWSSRRSLPESCLDDLAAACRRFNENHAAWLELARTEAPHVLIVRHEDLVRDAEDVVSRFGATFSRTPSRPFQPVDRVVQPALWDNTAMRSSLLPYDRDYYGGDDHIAALGPRHREVVTATIDWNLLAPLGYAPLAS